MQLSDEVAVLAVLRVLSRKEAYYREAPVLDHSFLEPVSWLWAPSLGSFVGRAGQWWGWACGALCTLGAAAWCGH